MPSRDALRTAHARASRRYCAVCVYTSRATGVSETAQERFILRALNQASHTISNLLHITTYIVDRLFRADEPRAALTRSHVTTVHAAITHSTSQTLTLGRRYPRTRKRNTLAR